MEQLCYQASEQFSSLGRTPVLAFTSSRMLVDRLANPSTPALKNARSFLHLYQLSSSEEFILHRVGLSTADQKGFQLNNSNFNSVFIGRITTFQRTLIEEIHQWRRQLNANGQIAWPLRPSGILKEDEKRLLFRAWCYLILETPVPHDLYQLDENSGIDVEAVVNVLQKLKLSPRARVAGYAEDERAMLFSTLDTNAEAVFPPFLVCLLQWLSDLHTWSFGVAKQKWFWGYIWESAKPNEIFLDWLSLARELGFAVEPPGGKDKVYSPLERSSLRNRIQEAENWLQADYPQIVLKMEEVFGEGEVSQLFGTQGKVGTKTAIANEKIKIAKACLQWLDNNEVTDTETDIKQQRRIFLDSAKQRLELLKAIDYVYLRDEYQQLTVDENVRTLDFRNDDEPLWRRIRRAELFAEKILTLKEQICNRIDLLCDEMHSVVQVPNFPNQLFTLSLEKIRNILEGALHLGTPQGSTARQQMTESSALGQCLKDLVKRASYYIGQRR